MRSRGCGLQPTDPTRLTVVCARDMPPQHSVVRFPALGYGSSIQVLQIPDWHGIMIYTYKKDRCASSPNRAVCRVAKFANLKALSDSKRVLFRRQIPNLCLLRNRTSCCFLSRTPSAFQEATRKALPPYPKQHSQTQLNRIAVPRIASGWAPPVGSKEALKSRRANYMETTAGSSPEVRLHPRAATDSRESAEPVFRTGEGGGLGFRHLNTSGSR